MDENLEDPSLLRQVDHSRRSDTIGWLVLVGLAFLVFELTADSSLAVVLGCMKFGTPELRVARWLRQSDPSPARGRACSWFHVTLAFMRIGSTAFFVLLVLTTITGAGIPQGKLERQLIGALLVILSCFAGAALTSWIAVGYALRHGVRVWMDATAGAALHAGVWPPFLTDRSRRANLGPGLIVVYAIAAAGGALFALLLIVVGMNAGLSAPYALSCLSLAVVSLLVGFRAAHKAMWRIEATSPWQCYGESQIDSGVVP